MDTLLSYGFSLPGRSHVAAGAPCQDAHTLCPLPHGWHLAAVADGLGSAARADEGAALAVGALASFCSANFAQTPPRPETLPALLESGFAAALAALEAAAESAAFPPAAFDTTLTAALYDGTQTAFAHCGDGGIIALNPGGRYRLLTSVQKGDAWNEVVPLRHGPAHWVFQLEETPASGLLLLTDGLFDVAVPPLLTGCGAPIYAAFVHRFLNGGLCNAAQTEETLCAFVQSAACAAVNDDVTAAALLNTAHPAAQPPAEYLAEPDWQALRLAQYYKLYPHLAPNGKEKENPHDSGKPKP